MAKRLTLCIIKLCMYIGPRLKQRCQVLETKAMILTEPTQSPIYAVCNRLEIKKDGIALYALFTRFFLVVLYHKIVILSLPLIYGALFLSYKHFCSHSLLSQIVNILEKQNNRTKNIPLVNHNNPVLFQRQKLWEINK